MVIDIAEKKTVLALVDNQPDVAAERTDQKFGSLGLSSL